MKRSLAVLLVFLLAANASSAVWAEEGIVEEFTSGQDSLLTEEAAVLLSDSIVEDDGGIVVENPDDSGDGEVTEIRVSDFAGLKAALETELTANTVVILTADIEGISEKIVIPDSGNFRLTLDLGDHSLRAEEGFGAAMFENEGSLRIDGGNYEIYAESADRIIRSFKRLEISGGNYSIYSGRNTAIHANGSLRIDGTGEIVSGCYAVQQEGGSLVIEEGHFVGTNNGQPALDISGGAGVTINGGHFESPHGAIGIADGGSSVEINDGTFRSTEDSYVFVGNLGRFTLRGGSYEGNGADYGYIFDRLGTYVDDGATVTFAGQPYTVEVVEGDGITVGTVEVATAGTLKAALAQGLTGNKTVILTADIEGYSGKVVIPDSGDYRVTLDLNGYSIEAAEDYGDIMFRNAGILEVVGESGSISAASAKKIFENRGQMWIFGGIEMIGSTNGDTAAVYNDGGDLLIDGGYFEGFYAVWCNGGYAEINDGEFCGNNNGQPAMDVRGGARVTVNGGSFESPHGAIGIADGGSSVEINDGTFCSTRDRHVFVGNLGRFTLRGGSYEGNGADYGYLADRLGGLVPEGSTVTFMGQDYTNEPIPEGEKLDGEIFGSDYWGMDDPEREDRSPDKAFDGDISTFYDALENYSDYHIGMEIGSPTRLTEVRIFPRNLYGYEVGAEVLESYAGFENEGAENLFEYNLDSKWCGEFKTEEKPEAPYVIWKTEQPLEVYGYEIYTGNDTGGFPGRNPTAWTLYGSTDGEDWKVIDQKADYHELPDESKAYHCVLCPIIGEDENGEATEESHPAYEYFKLTIDEIEGNDRNVFQLGGFRLVEFDGQCLRMAGMTVQGSADDGEHWVDLYTFPGDEFYHVTEYVVGGKEMDYVNSNSFTQFRVLNKEDHFNVAEVEFYGLTDSDLPLYVYEEDEPEPSPESEKLSGEVYGSDSWDSNEDTTFDKAFDSDISTFYDAYGATIEAHVSMDVGAPTRLTEVHIVPRNANGYDPEITVLEQSGGYGNEEADNLFDRTLDAKWCAPGAEHSVTWETERPVAVYGYQMYTANDNREYPGRNPITWKLYGSNDPEADGWELIDEQIDNFNLPKGDCELYEVLLGEETTDENGEPVFEPAPSAEYRYFRLDIEAVEGLEEDMPEGEPSYEFQLSEFRLLESADECSRMAGMTVQGSADGELWADIYTFPDNTCYYAQEYVVTADDMPLADSYSFTQFRVINRKQHFNVAEVEFFGTDGSEMIAYPEMVDGEHNLLATGEPYGSEAWDEDTTFDKVFDGDTDTYYDAYDGSGRDAEIGVVLGTPAQLTKFVVHPRADWGDRVRDLTVQGSVNGDEWITLYQFDNIRDYKFDYYEVTSDMFASAAHNYAFTQFRVINKSDHLNVAEVEFYGTYNYDESVEVFPSVIEEPIYSYLTGEQFLETAWVYYERDPENSDDDHYLDYWYFNEEDEDGMTRFEREFEGREPIVLIGGVGFDNSVVEISEIDGKPVVAVAPWAFGKGDSITKVVVNEDSECRYIMDNAFRGCETLESVAVSNSLYGIRCWAFNETPKLTEFIKVGEPLTEEEKNERDWHFVEVYDGVLTGYDRLLLRYPQGMKYDEHYEIPDFIEEIDHGAFANADIGKITMGDRVHRINNWAFSNSSIFEIELSPALKWLGDCAFNSCYNLTSLVIPSDDVEIERRMDEDTDLTDDQYMFDPWMFEWTKQENRTEPLVVTAYAGSVIEEYIDYVKALDLYDMSHVEFVPYTDIHWLYGDWFEECEDGEVFLIGMSAPKDAKIGELPKFTEDGRRIIGVRPDGDVWNALRNTEALGDENGRLVIPEGIRCIIGSPFADSVNIKTLVLPASLDMVEDAPFAWLPNLKTFVVAMDSMYFETRDDNGEICENGPILYGKYYYDDDSEPDEYCLEALAIANDVEHVTVADGTNVIRAAAFENSQTLRSITLPESMNGIDWWAFKNSTLESITIPENVDRILPEAFMNCQNLREVRIERLGGEFCNPEHWRDQDFTTVFEGSDNVTVYVYEGTDAHRAAEEYGWNYEVVELDATVYDTYVAEDGVHLAKVLAKSGDTEFVIPEDVMVIDDEAFAGIEGIESVVFPKNLRAVYSKAFAGCGEFEVITTGGVQIGWAEDAFDFDFEKVYNEQIFDHPVLIDGILYRFPHNREITEAMVVGWWYDAVDENGVLNVPDTVTYSGITYDVVSIQGDALSEWAPRDCYEMGLIELDDPVYKYNEVNYNGAEGDDFLLGSTEYDLELDYDHYWTYPTSIVVGKNVRYIGWSAFAGHGYWNEEEGYDFGLESVTLPASVLYIGNDVFWDSYQIREFNGLESFGESENPYQLHNGSIINTWGDWDILMAYPVDCGKTEYIVPGDIEVIGNNAFRWAEELRTLEFEEGVRVLRGGAVVLTGLETLYLPDSLENLEGHSLSYNHHMQNFIVSENHPWLTVHEDGTLRSEDGERLIAYPTANIGDDRVLEITAESGIKRISNVAVAGIDIRKLVLSEEVEQIDDWAFENNDDLRIAVIHGTIDTMNIDVFADCDNMDAIVYYGDHINVYYYDGDEFTVAHDFDDYDTPRKIDFIMPGNADSITFSVAMNFDYEDRYYDIYYPNDNPFFDLHGDHIPFLLYDVDGDREVTGEDALRMLRYTILPERYPMYHVLDWNFDGSEDSMITAADAAALKNIINQ